MTSTNVTPLGSLAQQIARQQSELETLRREFEARQTSLAELNRQKQELKAQLQQVEADIRATKEGGTVSLTLRARQPEGGSAAARAKPKNGRRRRRGRRASAGGAPRPNTLGAVLLDIMHQAGKPMTVKKLTEELNRRKYASSSRNLPAVVKNRIHHMVRRGLMRRVSRKQGYTLGKSTPKAAAVPNTTTPSGSKNGAVRAKPPGKKQPLHVVLTNVLAKSSKPLTARELADQALASGYKTKSRNFMDVMWVVLGQMKNIKRVPGEGYVLKR